MKSNGKHPWRASLIDMDGVLYDSMPGHTLAWHRMMSENGFNIPREEFYLYEGMTGPATIEMLYRRERGEELTPQRGRELYAIKAGYFKEMGEAPVISGAQRMVTALGEKGMIRILVTGSAQESLLTKLNRDYPGVFIDGHRVTALDVAHGKPDPEPYLRGAALAGVAPNDCLVVENAPLGVLAGKRAGCTVAAVMTGPIPKKEFEQAGADYIFESMDDFADWIESGFDDEGRII